MLILSMFAAIAAQTSDSPRERDLRCFAALSYAVSTIDKAQQPGVIAGAMYYIGRLDARDPGLNLESELTRLIGDGEAFGKALPDELKRCGGELEVRGAAMKTLSGALIRKAQPAK